jgi:hypothetical protein
VEKRTLLAESDPDALNLDIKSAAVGRTDTITAVVVFKLSGGREVLETGGDLAEDFLLLAEKLSVLLVGAPPLGRFWLL